MFLVVEDQKKVKSTKDRVLKTISILFAVSAGVRFTKLMDTFKESNKDTHMQILSGSLFAVFAITALGPQKQRPRKNPQVQNQHLELSEIQR